MFDIMPIVILRGIDIAAITIKVTSMYINVYIACAPVICCMCIYFISLLFVFIFSLFGFDSNLDIMCTTPSILIFITIDATIIIIKVMIMRINIYVIHAM